MFEAVRFKDGNIRWLRTGDTIALGHREIGELMLDRYVVKRMEGAIAYPTHAAKIRGS